MNACLRFAPMIGARPGELDGRDERALAEHLSSCAGCRARLADERALAGMLAEALLAEANRRDFSTFSDEVLSRIPQYAGGAATGARSDAGGTHRRSMFGWLRRHRLVAAGSALAPALAAVALFLYLGRSGASEHATVEISAEERATTVLETSEGPVVLLGDPGPEGS